MGIEVDSDYGGSGFNFTAVILAIEELAKIDPSVSVMCDVQNTLVCTVFNKYANEDQKSHYLPLLTSSKVKQMFQKVITFKLTYIHIYRRLAPSVFLKKVQVLMLSPSKLRQRKLTRGIF